jgi:hypothetical protein
MTTVPLAGTLLFRVYLIRMHGSENAPTLRLILVEAANTHAVYEGFGSWPECVRWISRLSNMDVFRDDLAAVRRLLDQKRLVTIKSEVRASVDAIESLGLHRVDIQFTDL